MRALGIDLGSKRIGVAVSDRSGTLASPLVVVERTGDHARDHARLAALVAEEEAECVVVGMPYSLDGSIGAAATLVMAEVAELEAALAVPVSTIDERFTTTTAHQHLREGRGMKAKARRGVVDKAAAAVLLQAWLDSRPR